MPTLDFVYDLKDKMDDENMEYIILLVQHGPKESSVNAFYSIEGDSSADMLCLASKNICERVGAGELTDDLTILSVEEEEIIERPEEDNEYYNEDEDYNEDEEDKE